MTAIPLFRTLSQTDKRDWVCFFLGLGTFTAFLPVLWFEFTIYDDPGYVFENLHVKTGLTGKNFIWALTTLNGEISYWHPVTWLSHQLDCNLFGLNPGAHHLTNVLFHSITGVLLFLFLNRTTGQLGRSAIVACLFCLHPLHVESVAWIAERKDVLSGLFWIATLNAYAFYVERRSCSRYSLMLLLFSLGLMSKPSVVTLPFTLLLLDYWPLRRFARPLTLSLSPSDGSDGERVPERRERGGGWSDSCATIMRLIIEKFPLFTLSFAASVAAFEAQRQLGAVMPVEALSRSDRIDNAVIAYALYIAKTFWPSHLAVIYTHNGSWPFGLVLMAGGFLSAISYFVFRYRRSWPYLIVGWLWFLGTLVPMIGLVQAGAQSMADRYTYISLIGLFFMAVWGSADAARRLSVSKEIVTAFATLVVCVAAVAMRHQLLYWKDSSTLFGHAVFVTCNNWAAHHNLALTLANKLEFEKADVEFARALQITPQNLVVLKSRAKLYLDMGNAERAIEFFEDVISLDPRNIEAHRQLAWIYATCQDPALRNADLTLKHARFVCQASPDADFKQFDVLAVAYAENGQFEDAVAVEQRACTLASVAGEDPKEFQERLKLFKSKQPYRTDFGAKKHKILAKQQAGQADSPVK